VGKEPFRILAIDVGGITQDILIYDSSQVMENCTQLILPSRTVIVAERIKRATAEGRAVFLVGNLMGGGACVSALKKHLKAGFKVYAEPLAAKTIRDNLQQVQAMGVEITERAPAEAKRIEMRDVDIPALQRALKPFDLEVPKRRAVAVQDHGESTEESNRKFRFKYWQGFLDSGGNLGDLVFREVPPIFTRMKAVQQDAPGALMIDTGAAAIWGALEDPQASNHKEEGLVIVNMGNQHTVGVLLQKERIWGLFEHHTVLMGPEKLADYLNRLRSGSLTNEEVFSDGGHGCSINPSLPADTRFGFVAVTGPQRHMAADLGYYLAAPYGDMMLTGCFGLVAAWLHTQQKAVEMK
jgi:uncharacterized protein (DUF1786 family)